MKKYDFVIVGSGLFGMTVANVLTHQHSKKCLVVERRSHLGGNIYCEKIENINVHKYGPHIFHTNNERVWNYISQFCVFNQYVNQPTANNNGKIYNLPFNMNTFYQIYGESDPTKIQQLIAEDRLQVQADDSLESYAISMVGKKIYDLLIKDYTEKQWGMPCSQLPSFIIKRLPLRFTYDNNYFNAKYQGIPVGGYNCIIQKMLSGIDVTVDSDFLKNRSYYSSIAENIVFTGAIDSYYDYSYGHLEYRTVKFENQILDVPNYQGNAIVNFTGATEKFTRIIEHKHFDAFGDDVYKNAKTVISKEYSKKWSDDDEPYYPINNERNNALYEKYKALGDQEKNVYFGGRLGEYQYYDMDKVIERAFALIEKIKY